MITMLMSFLSPRLMKIVGIGALLAALVVGFFVFKAHYDDGVAARALANQKVAVAQAIAKEQAAAAEQITRVQQEAQARMSRSARVMETIRREPTTSDCVGSPAVRRALDSLRDPAGRPHAGP